MLEIKFSNISQKFLNKCEETLYNRIMDKIKVLSKEPFPSDSVRVVNRKEKIFRVRVGDYRIIYGLLKEKNLIFISEINKRSKIYK